MEGQLFESDLLKARTSCLAIAVPFVVFVHSVTMHTVSTVYSSPYHVAGGLRGPSCRSSNFNQKFAQRAFSEANASSSRVDDALQMQSLKETLLASTSGLDRGLDAAGIEVAQSIEQVIADLCAVSPAPRLDLDEKALAGTWQLQYSSEFVPGNTKFAGNWPFLANSDTLRRMTKPLLPKIVEVKQVIDVHGKRLDNVVTLELRPPVLANILDERLGAPPIVTARLEHDYRLSGAATVTITYDKTMVQGEGGINGWFGNLPELSFGGEDNVVLEEIRKATEAYNSSSFDVIFVDDTLRVTRADRGEIRVFVKRS